MMGVLFDALPEAKSFRLIQHMKDTDDSFRFLSDTIYDHLKINFHFLHVIKDSFSSTNENTIVIWLKQ